MDLQQNGEGIARCGAAPLNGVHGILQRRCDVCIVGAGIVGMVTALLLKKQGVQVDVYERQQTVYPLPRAVALADESIRLLLAAGLGVELQRFVFKVRGQEEFVWRNKERRPLLRLSMEKPGPSGLANTNLFSQPCLESAIALYCDYVGVPIYRGWDFQRATEHDDGRVSSSFVRYKGEKHNDYNAGVRVVSKFLVAADGANSAVRTFLQIPRQDYGLCYDWLILDTLPASLENDWLWSQICDPERPTTVVGGGGNRRRWEFMRLPHETKEELTSQENVWSLLAAYGLHSSNCEIERAVVYTFKSLNATTYSTERGSVFLAGDAAHQMPPFIGQGLNSGIRDAGSLAWRIGENLRGFMSAKLLSSYTTERRGHVEVMTKKAIELGEPICQTDPAINEMVSSAMEERFKAIKGDSEPVMSFPLTGDGFFDPSRHGGCPEVRRGAQVARLQEGEEKFCWRLLHFASEPGTSVKDALDPLDVEHVYIGEADQGAYREWLQDKGQVAYAIVRPDSYVFGFAKDADDLRAMSQDLLRRMSS